MNTRRPATVIVVSAIVMLAAASSSRAAEDRFVPLHVILDSGEQPLAAYQVEIAVSRGSAEIVGVEGGDAAPFNAAPYYDPAALKSGRIIIAAFNTGAELPHGRLRVATLHMQERGGTPPAYSARIIAAASSGGRRIPVTVTLERSRGEGQ